LPQEYSLFLLYYLKMKKWNIKNKKLILQIYTNFKFASLIYEK
jgi:hypothetical protein